MKNSNKLFSYCLFIGILTGIIIGRLIPVSYNVEKGILNEYLLERVIKGDFSRTEYVLFVFEERIKLFILVCLVYNLKNAKKIISVFLAALGMSLGIGFAVLAGRYSVYGAVLFAAMIFPHWWIYLRIIKVISREEGIGIKNALKYLYLFFGAIIWEGCLSIYFIGIILKNI